MTLIEVLLIAIGLSMDAFAVSVGKGLSMRKVDYAASLELALAFGLFQALMPVLGWFLAASFADAIRSLDHWIAFLLLALIGGKMIYDALSGSEEEDSEEFSRVKPLELLALAVATSIDAFAVGILFAALAMPPFPAVVIIGSVTFVLSLAGVVVGNRFGARYESAASLIGGIILVFIGLKVLVEHLMNGM